MWDRPLNTVVMVKAFVCAQPVSVNRCQSSPSVPFSPGSE